MSWNPDGQVVLDGGPIPGEHREFPSMLLQVMGNTEGWYRDTQDTVKGKRLFRWFSAAVVWEKP